MDTMIGHNRPALAEAYAGMIADVNELVATDLPLSCPNDDAAREISRVGSDAAKLAAKIEKARKDEKEPYLEGGRRVDAFFGNLNIAVGDFVKACKQLVGAYQDQKAARERAAREAEAKRLAAEAAAAAERAMRTANEADLDKAIAVETKAIEAASVAAATTAELGRVTDGGKALASFRTTWVYEVVDFDLVPRDLTVVNDQAVKARIAGGVRTIAGLRIFEKRDTVFR